jgi:hypothetical protein
MAKKQKARPKLRPKQKQTQGAAPGLCVHRVAVTSYCSRCEA